MEPAQFFAVVYALIMGVVGHKYAAVIRDSRANPLNTKRPALATWFIFLIARGAGIIPYAASGDPSFTANVAHFVDTVVVGGVFITLVYCRVPWEMSRVRWACVIATPIILLLWVVFQEHEKTAYSLLQAVMVMAYWPTIENVWRAEKNPEPFGFWVIGFTASLIGLFPAIALWDELAIINSARALFLVGLVIVLMARLELRERSAHA